MGLGNLEKVAEGLWMLGDNSGRGYIKVLVLVGELDGFTDIHRNVN